MSFLLPKLTELNSTREESGLHIACLEIGFPFLKKKLRNEIYIIIISLSLGESFIFGENGN
jgi:hypothetical protein